MDCRVICIDNFHTKQSSHSLKKILVTDAHQAIIELIVNLTLDITKDAHIVFVKCRDVGILKTHGFAVGIDELVGNLLDEVLAYLVDDVDAYIKRLTIQIQSMIYGIKKQCF